MLGIRPGPEENCYQIRSSRKSMSNVSRKGSRYSISYKSKTSSLRPSQISYILKLR